MKGIVMKRFFSIAAAALSIGSFAVSSMALEIAAGIKGGLGIASLRGSDAYIKDVDKTSLFGAAGGISLTMQFSDIMGAEIDVLYSMKGQNYSLNYSTRKQVYNSTSDTLTETVTRGSRKGSYGLTYCDVPVLLKFVIPLQSSIRPYFSAGPSFGILLSSKEKAEGNGTYEQKMLYPVDSVLAAFPVSLDTTIDQKDRTNSLDVGLVFGAGTAIALGPGDFIIDLRYSFGFTNTMKLSDADKSAGYTESNLPGRLNSVFTLMAGYCFKF